MNEGVFSINNENERIELSDKKKYKICSFSGLEALKSQLMWGHYAAAGMGVAIEVDVDESTVEKISYTNSFENLNTVRDMLTHKSTEWCYEHEYRYLSASLSDTTIKLGKITKIYFGTPYKGLSNYGEIKTKHEKLNSYMCFQRKLKDHCERRSIRCEDYNFVASSFD